jgi:hypothetical protein
VGAASLGSSEEVVMPARSEAQRRFLNARFGHAWTKEHGFDNRGQLPQHVGKGAARREALKRMRKKKPS